MSDAAPPACAALWAGSSVLTDSPSMLWLCVGLCGLRSLNTLARLSPLWTCELAFMHSKKALGSELKRVF